MQQFKCLEIQQYLTKKEDELFTKRINELTDNAIDIMSSDNVDQRMVEWCKENAPMSYRNYRLATADAKGRVELELEELEDKLTKLKHFVDFNPVFKALSIHSQNLLKEQADTMQNYVDILKERLEVWKA